jgi:HD-GYP domain-containing protein (c-di-GMP phosphodiesterase class II)
MSMSVSTARTSTARTVWTGVSADVLANLSARLRVSGMCLGVIKTDGTLCYSDPEAGLFFTRFAMPLVQFPENPDVRLVDRLAELTPESDVIVWEQPAGVILAAVPLVEKRQVQAIFLIAARSKNFGPTEDVMRVCGRLGLDCTWLVQQADELPAYSERVMRRHGQLLTSMTADQLRLQGMQEELNSLSGQLADTYEELSLIYQISGGMRVNRRASDFFKQACLDVLEVMNVRGMGVALHDGALNHFDPVLYGSMSLPPGKVQRLAEELMPLLVERKSAILINDLRQGNALRWLSEHARQIIAVPLQRQDKILGCLFALDKNTDDFDSVDSKLLNSIANESAIYLENAMLFEDVHDLMMGLIHSLTSAVDAKDAYTCGHSERVALLTRQLAREMRLPEQSVERFYMAGLLHDVGKIGVPERVLQKEGKLTDDEFALIKKHPEIGARILSDIKQIEDILPGVLHHHERWDGRGYPHNLAAKNIPLMGRVICLADSFDAMTSNRTYRKALPLEVAVAEIKRSAGTQFDPELAEIFINIGVDRFLRLLHDHEQKSKRLVDLQQSLRVQ